MKKIVERVATLSHYRCGRHTTEGILDVTRDSAAVLESLTLFTNMLEAFHGEKLGSKIKVTMEMLEE